MNVIDNLIATVVLAFVRAGLAFYAGATRVTIVAVALGLAYLIGRSVVG